MNTSAIKNGKIFLQIDAWNSPAIAAVKQRPGKFWHPEIKRWSLPDTPENRMWVNAMNPHSSSTETPTAGASKAEHPCYLADGRIYYKGIERSPGSTDRS